MKKFCPNCITPLIKQTKKLGRWSKKWLICTNCGHREYENSRYFEELDEKNAKEALELMNNNLGLYDKEDELYGI